MSRLRRGLFVALALTAFAGLNVGRSEALDDTHADFNGRWVRVGGPNWVQPKDVAQFYPNYDPRQYLPPPPGLLTPEYQAIFDANRADQSAGGVGDVPSTFCIPQGMPMMMDLYDPMEIIVTPSVTYVLISHVNDSYRRIYTDGRDWPPDVQSTFAGYSIGRWVDADGARPSLEVETRFFRGPRAYDASGLPLARDNQSIIKERFHLDAADRNTLYDDITVVDHALTRPWTLTRKTIRDANPRPAWRTEECPADNSWVRIGKDAYYMSADGYLMPTRKDQPPPDLKYFKQPRR
ncbi:MAG TPA: hypothetical protein VKW08_14975 [Xanthobacteraceae bacterium]|nr:hypothetical protein [Xanthobacteraceae bacterium]